MIASPVHAARRARLMELLGPRAALVLTSPPERLRNGDTDYKFRQDSDLLYLTAFAAGELDARLPEILGGAEELHFPFGRDPELDGVISRALARLRATERRG